MNDYTKRTQIQILQKKSRIKQKKKYRQSQINLDSITGINQKKIEETLNKYYFNSHKN